VWNEEPVRVFAGQNHGLIDRPTALTLGVNDHQIGLGLAVRGWTEVHRGVYYLNVTPRTWETEIAAAVLAAGPAAAASHRAAGTLWGLDDVYPVIEVTVPYSDTPEPIGVILHRTRRPVDTTIHKKIRLTTVERTLLDLAGLLPDRSLEKAAEAALRNRLTTITNIATCLGRYGGRGVKGTLRMRRVITALDRDLTGSPSEVDLLSLIRDAPIPQPVPQLEVSLPDGGTAYLDFAWPDRHKIVETDGIDAHASPDQREHDLRRQNMLMELGWEIRRFSARDVRRDPQRVLREVTRFVGDFSVL
jgi:hypothetical protein